MKRDATASAFGIGSRIGAGQPASEPALSSLHLTALDCFPWQAAAEESRPHIQTPFSSQRGASSTGRGSMRGVSGAELERAHSTRPGSARSRLRDCLSDFELHHTTHTR